MQDSCVLLAAAEEYQHGIWGKQIEQIECPGFV